MNTMNKSNKWKSMPKMPKWLVKTFEELGEKNYSAKGVKIQKQEVSRELRE
jgi:hypothetical protein